jgi:hypothetical protein
MASISATMAPAERQRRLELRELLNAKYLFIDRTWDAVFWITAIFVVAGAADITKLLFAGDWDFWTDWKDPQWWPVVTAFATIIIPSALQWIQWVAWRFPNRRDLHLRLSLLGDVDRPLFSVAHRRNLSDEFRMADFDGAGRDYPRLAC